MDNENPKPQTGGLKLMTVFIVVLALHVLVIGGISAYHLFFRGGDGTASIAQKDDKESVESTSTDASHATTPVNPNAPSIDTSPDANSGMPATHDDTIAGTDKITPAAPTTGALAAIPSSKPGLLTLTKPAAPATFATIKPIAPATPAIASTPAVASTTDYTVKAGDSLYKIAHQTGTSISQLKTINGLKTDMLHLGQKLKVNGTATTSPAPTQIASITPTASTDASSFYTVVKGDTLTKIAKQFKTTPAAIMAANNLTDPHKLGIGAKLKIPSQQAKNDAVDAQAASPKPFKAPVKEKSDLVMNK